MSVTSIPDKILVSLWVKAGGRCQYEGCNTPLWRDDLTMLDMNRAYVAHIIADSAGGPRGDTVLSPRLAAELSNLMLMCDSHHRLIDREQVAAHPPDRLRAMKKDHEERIERVTGIGPDMKAEILLYGANVGAQASPVTYERAARAVIQSRYPASARGIELGMVNSSFRDGDGEFWKIEEQNLRRLFAARVAPRLADRSLPHTAIFAVAPQPLLMLLGYLLSDIPPADVYQLHRNPADWCWQGDPLGFDYTIVRPPAVNGPPALVFSLSATITDDRVQAVSGGPFTIWSMTIPAPNNDYLKSPGQLRRFRELVRPLLDEIKARHGQDAVLHVFPAMPVATAVDFGRIVMPKADLPMRIYDQNRTTNGFTFALDLRPQRAGDGVA